MKVEEMATQTLRQKILEFLREGPWDALSLSQELRISQRLVENHLQHVAQTAKAQGEKFIIIPSRCCHCPFEFSERTRTTKPGRCPQCRGEQITPPVFQIKKK
jgi:transcriptional regulator